MTAEESEDRGASGATLASGGRRTIEGKKSGRDEWMEVERMEEGLVT